MITYSYLVVGITLLVLWLYLIFYSRWRKLSPPWSFLLVIVCWITYSYQINFSIGAMRIPIYPFWIIALLLVLVNKDQLRDYFLSYEIRYRELFLVIGIGFVFTLIFYISLKGNVLSNNIQGVPIVNIIISTLNTAIGEELIFRSFILGYFKKYEFSFWISILVQSLLFALSHLRYLKLGFVFAFLVVFVFGLVAGLITWKRGSIIPTIIMHWEVTVLSLILGVNI